MDGSAVAVMVVLIAILVVALNAGRFRGPDGDEDAGRTGYGAGAYGDGAYGDGGPGGSGFGWHGGHGGDHGGDAGGGNGGGDGD